MRLSQSDATPFPATIPEADSEIGNGAANGVRPDSNGADTASNGHRRDLEKAAAPRPKALGKFLYAGEEKLYLRGVTYGTFRSEEEGGDYPQPATVESAF